MNLQLFNDKNCDWVGLKNNIYIEHSELEQFRNIINQIADKYTPETENKKPNETH